ncbi:MAG: hypothetical protein D6805_05575 [Planctomycetota bacterium]|nr:MAG: hypothetical protein D6805_05575 [Planctomycetota bacterium]
MHRIWDLLENFFKAKLFFKEIYDQYEEMVLEHARRRGVHRKDLRLEQEELTKLIDFSKLVELRDKYLAPLKELSHEIFRQSDSTDRFDRFVNTIFHEISILKEEHYKVKKFAAEYEEENETEEFTIILDEVHEAFPRIIHHVHNLFRKAKKRLEKLLPRYNREKVFVRSVYIFGEDLLSREYSEGVIGFYERMYPRYGAFEGYTVVAKSFYDSGFHLQAKEAIGLAKGFLERYTDHQDEFFQKLYLMYTEVYRYYFPSEVGSLLSRE